MLAQSEQIDSSLNVRQRVQLPMRSTAVASFSASRLRAGAIALEHVQRHALRALRADAGQAAERFDEVGEERRAV